jgi:hypothetical protein
VALASFPGHSAIRNPHSASTPGPLELILAPHFSFLPSTFYFRLVVALGGFAGPAAIRCWMLDVQVRSWPSASGTRSTTIIHQYQRQLKLTVTPV